MISKTSKTSKIAVSEWPKCENLTTLGLPSVCSVGGGGYSAPSPPPPPSPLQTDGISCRRTRLLRKLDHDHFAVRGDTNSVLHRVTPTLVTPLSTILSNDVHLNPGLQFQNNFFNFMSWNVHSLVKG